MRARIRFFSALAALLLALGAGAHAEPKSALVKYALAMSGVHSYHADMQTDRGTIGMDVVAPSRYHVTMPSGPEMIVIDSDMWVKMGGNWTKLPGHMPNMEAMIARARAANPPADVDKNYTISDLGMVDGFHAYKLQRKGEDSVVTLYLRADSLPAKIVSVSNGKAATILYSNYNHVTVSAP